MADQDDQTAARVSGGVIYGEMCLLWDVCECVCVAWQCTRPLITSSLQSQGGFMATAGRLRKPCSEVVRCSNTSTAIYTSPLCHSYPILTSEPAMVGLQAPESKHQTALIKASKPELKLNNLRAIFISMLRFLQRKHDEGLSEGELVIQAL